MKLRWKFLLNFLILILALLILVGLQTTFWFQIFGNISAPMLWLNLVVYIVLYQKPAPAILTIYSMGFILTSFTSMPLKLMWITLLVLFMIIYGLKSRIFWSGSGYYVIMCGVSAVTFHLAYFLISLALEKTPASYEVADRLVQIILTPLFALPMYRMISSLDILTHDELNDSGGLNL